MIDVVKPEVRGASRLAPVGTHAPTAHSRPRVQAAMLSDADRGAVIPRTRPDEPIVEIALLKEENEALRRERDRWMRAARCLWAELTGGD